MKPEVIVRILGEAQYRLPHDALGDVNVLDERLTETIVAAANDVRSALDALLQAVRAHGQAVEADFLGESDIVLPALDTGLAELEALMGPDGLVPG